MWIFNATCRCSRGCGHNPESECEGEGEEQQIVKNKQPYVATEGKWEEENSVY